MARKKQVEEQPKETADTMTTLLTVIKSFIEKAQEILRVIKK